MVERKIQIKVPPGSDTGLRLRLSGEGEAGHQGGPRGDLYIDLEVEAHDFFQRDQKDLLCEVPIDFVQAALGCDLDVPMLTGSAELKIPAGTQSGRIFKLKGKGLASIKHEGMGDLIVRIVVETPTHLSEEQKKLLRQFASISDWQKAQPLCQIFMDNVKKLFHQHQP